MPNFSIMQITKTNPNGTVEGPWVQDHCGGTLESAKEALERFKDANSRKVSATVVEGDSSWKYPGQLLINQTPLA